MGERVNAMIEEEYRAKVWNCTKADLEDSTIDPAKQPGSLEVTGANQGFNVGASICDGLVLTPCLFGAYLKYADPMLEEDKEIEGGPDEITGSSWRDIPMTECSYEVTDVEIPVSSTLDGEGVIELRKDIDDGQRRSNGRERTIEDLFAALNLLRMRL